MLKNQYNIKSSFICVAALHAALLSSCTHQTALRKGTEGSNDLQNQSNTHVKPTDASKINALDFNALDEIINNFEQQQCSKTFFQKLEELKPKGYDPNHPELISRIRTFCGKVIEKKDPKFLQDVLEPLKQIEGISLSDIKGLFFGLDGQEESPFRQIARTKKSSVVWVILDQMINKNKDTRDFKHLLSFEDIKYMFEEGPYVGWMYMLFLCEKNGIDWRSPWHSSPKANTYKTFFNFKRNNDVQASDDSTSLINSDNNGDNNDAESTNSTDSQEATSFQKAVNENNIFEILDILDELDRTYYASRKVKESKKQVKKRIKAVLNQKHFGDGKKDLSIYWAGKDNVALLWAVAKVFHSSFRVNRKAYNIAHNRGTIKGVDLFFEMAMSHCTATSAL